METRARPDRKLLRHKLLGLNAGMTGWALGVADWRLPIAKDPAPSTQQLTRNDHDEPAAPAADDPAPWDLHFSMAPFMPCSHFSVES